MRIDELLNKKYKLSKKEINKLFKQGKIKVNQQSINNLSFSIDGTIHKLVVDGNVIDVPKHRYLQLNKPKNVITANHDSNQQTILDLINLKNKKQLFSIGRLDKDTMGLILLMDNGPLGYYLTQEHFNVTKEYIVEVNRPLISELIELFNFGIIFDDGYKCKPAKLIILDDYHARIIILEGKRHQIKKMFLSTGYYVVNLCRVRIDTVCIDENLRLGQYRALTTKELHTLYSKYERKYLQ